MKRFFLIFVLLSVLISTSYAKSFLPGGEYDSIINSISKLNSKKSATYLFTPVIGYENIASVNAVSVGLDFTYFRSSGFALMFNNALIVGSVIDYSIEFLLGYSKAIGKHLISFGLGYQGAFGVNLVKGGVLFEAGAFAVRIDYSYLFTRKLGINASITDGIGSIFYNGSVHLNRFSLKVGPVFKL